MLFFQHRVLNQTRCLIWLSPALSSSGRWAKLLRMSSPRAATCSSTTNRSQRNRSIRNTRWKITASLRRKSALEAWAPTLITPTWMKRSALFIGCIFFYFKSPQFFKFALKLFTSCMVWFYSLGKQGRIQKVLKKGEGWPVVEVGGRSRKY